MPRFTHDSHVGSSLASGTVCKLHLEVIVLVVMVEASCPVPLSIIVCSKVTWQGWTFLHTVEHNEKFSDVLDISDMLFIDSPERVSESVRLQALLSEGSFVAVAYEIVNQVFKLYDTEKGSVDKVYVIKCDKHVFRWEAVIKTVQMRVFNDIVVQGKRVFNVNIFKMDDTRKVNETVEMALQWLKKPWVLIDGNTDFGREGVNASPYAKKTWDQITNLKAEFEREVDGCLQKSSIFKKRVLRSLSPPAKRSCKESSSCSSDPSRDKRLEDTLRKLWKYLSNLEKLSAAAKRDALKRIILEE